MTLKIRLILVGYLLLCINNNTYAQYFTSKDFKMSIDNYPINDSGNTITLTKKELLNAKKIYANFSWAKIKSFVVYFSNSEGTSCTSLANCEGLDFCEAVKQYFKRSAPGSNIIIIPTVLNKQGKVVDWSTLSIRVK
jgi:hypothetical protein